VTAADILLRRGWEQDSEGVFQIASENPLMMTALPPDVAAELVDGDGTRWHVMFDVPHLDLASGADLTDEQMARLLNTTLSVVTATGETVTFGVPRYQTDDDLRMVWGWASEFARLLAEGEFTA